MTVTGLAEKVFAFTEEKALFSAPCHVLLGLSGGADSAALLHVLCHWPKDGLTVSAVHIHHGLRGASADRDEAFVRDLCNRYGVHLSVEHIDVAALAVRQHRTIEEAGRVARYTTYDRIADEIGADFILTAHTASDQAETVLMRIIRGSGIDGLCGIPAVRDRIRRPLLCCSRAEIETFCRDNGIPFVTDETNVDITFTRNRVRHELLPMLRQMNPSVDEALLRLASHASNDTAYLNGVADRAIEACEGNVEELARLPISIRRRCILRLIRSFSVPSVEEHHILAVEDMILNGSGAVCLPGGVSALVSQGRLFFRRNTEEIKVPEPLSISELPFAGIFGAFSFSLVVTDFQPNVHKLFFNNSIDYDKIQGGLYLRSRKTGDFVHPEGRVVGKSIKKLMNEMQIPTHLRECYPLLCDDAGIVLIPGYTCDERVRVTEDTKHFLVWQTDSELG